MSQTRGVAEVHPPGRGCDILNPDAEACPALDEVEITE
jgi:hypothetical protein